MKGFRETGEGAAIGETLELTALRRDGSEFPVELSLSSVRMGDVWHAVGVIRDITERKKREGERRKDVWALGERVKELNCLYGIGELVEQPGISLDAVFQGVVDLIPPAWQHPDVTCARLIVGEGVFASGGFRESVWRQSSDIAVQGVRDGVLDVFYVEEMPEFDEGPFLKEERLLIQEITDRLGRFIERRSLRVEAEEARERLEVLMENASDAIYLSDPMGTFIDGNRAAEELTGYSREELIGENFLKLKLLPVGQIPRAAKLLALNRLGRRTGPEGFTLNRKGGGQVDVEIMSYPVRLGSETVVMGIARDVTEKREAERRLEEYAVNLEGMVEEKTRELVDAERMAAAGRVAAMVGHALRGPLQSISNAAYMLRVAPGDPVRSLEIIEESVKRASGMLEEFRESTRDTPPTLRARGAGGEGCG
jgi:PAS domain S-box-containing protein